LAHIHDGRAKLFLTWRALDVRSRHARVLERGEYVPLGVTGEQAEHVCAFARRADGVTIVVAVGRWFTKLLPADGTWPSAPLAWGNTRAAVPAGRYVSAFDGRALVVQDAGADLAELFAGYPAALLVADDSSISNRS
jgi:(1->4)-alpha-D-glucan 1-alpha-D-glucosylmutase